LSRRILSLLSVAFTLASSQAFGAAIVALGASNTYGKGVSRNQAYPAQLETLLRGRGHQVHVLNAGINGDTTEHMLSRLDSSLSKDTRVVILQPGGNDRRKGKTDTQSNIESIQARLSARGIKFVLLPNNMLHGLPHQPDGQHLTPEGYHMLAETLAGQVEGGL
jgi:acyl-CoA thioesterase-1